MVVVALVIFSSSVSYARRSWKREYQHGDILVVFVLCSSSPGTPSLGERKVRSWVPCPAGPRGVSASFCRQSRVLHGSSPFLSFIMCNHSPNGQYLALTPNTSLILRPRVQDAKIFWAPHAGGLRVKNLWPWKLVSFDHPLFHCSGNMLNYKGVKSRMM